MALNGSRALDEALQGDLDGLLDGHRREQAGVLERAPEAAPGPAVGSRAG